MCLQPSNHAKSSATQNLLFNQAKSIRMIEKRQRADAYRGLTYLQLNADKGTQQIIRGGEELSRSPESSCL